VIKERKPMTRQEYDRHFAATTQNTSGFTVSQLSDINDAVFGAVKDLDMEDTTTKSVVDHHIEREMVRVDLELFPEPEAPKENFEVMISGRYTPDSASPPGDSPWTSNRRLRKLLVSVMTDGSLVEKSTGSKATWRSVFVTPTFQWLEIVTENGMVFRPDEMETLVNMQQVGSWIVAAIHEGNLRRAMGE
jgi:hypothetical protein